MENVKKTEGEGRGEEEERTGVEGELQENLELKALPAGSSISPATPITVFCTPNTSDSDSESEAGSSPAESLSNGRVANPNNGGSNRTEFTEAGASRSVRFIGTLSAATLGQTLPMQNSGVGAPSMPSTEISGKIRAGCNIAHGGSGFSCMRNPPSEPRPCLNITSLSVSTFIIIHF